MATSRRDRTRVRASQARGCDHEWKEKTSWPLSASSSVTVTLEVCKTCETQRHVRSEGVKT